MDKIRKRFIMFNLIVMGSITLIVGFLMFISNGRGGDGGGRHLDGGGNHRYWITILLGLLVFLGSLFLSKKAVKPIEQAWQKQLDFTADASHELRTPLAVIMTNLEVVLDSPDETVKSQMKWLKNIEAENKRMTKLVEDLLMLSRGDTNQQELEVETFKMDAMILETLSTFEAGARQKGIEIVKKLHENIEFHGDKKRLKQLVVILVDNAIKHMSDTGKITVILSKDAKEITLTVADTGVGIDAEHLQHIFDRFYRVNKTRTAEQDGSGLGLAIAKWIACAHGGNISVASTVGQGTMFTVRFV